MPCPSEETLLAFATGTLDEAALSETIGHVDGCPECRRVAAALARPEAAPAAATAPAPRTVGRHVLLDVLGAGSMGVVYRAYDPQLDRKVAIKLLRGSPTPHGEERRLRLLREAQAMAKVAHPNVVAVHDVGEHEGDVFMAMELIEGPTLHAWLSPRQGSREEILDAFRQAGLGLAAAHAAGLVHRDFKPENVLVGPDGRVRVTDFGLAHSHSPEVLAGTPAYMSPEQLDRKPVDARSDQFSFAVALWEALAGRRPFAGTSLAELRQSVERPLPAEERIPAWLRRPLERALAPAPSARFESMDRLLEALARDPSAGRRRAALALGGIALAIAAVGGLALLSAAQVRECRGAPQKLATAWSPERRTAIERAFRASGKSYAPDAFQRISRRLEGFASSWTAMREDACLATRARGEQSEEMLDLRMACLDRRLADLAAVARVLASEDGSAVERGFEAVDALGDLAECADLARLSTGVKPPKPAARAAVEALRARLSEARANREAGRYARAVDLSSAALAEARSLGYAPVEAEAQFALGDAQAKAGAYVAGEAALRSSVWVAESVRWDESAARAALRLTHVVGGNQQRFGEALIWADLAGSKIDRLAGRDDLRGALAYARAVVHQRQGRFTDALARCHEALPLLEAAHGKQSVRVAEVVRLVGSLSLERGDLEAARAHHQRALGLWEAAVGPAHPDVAFTLSSVGHVRAAAGDLDGADELHRRGLALATAALGERHPYVANAAQNLASTALARGRLREARSLGEQALQIRTEAYGAEHPLVAHSLAGLAETAVARGEGAEAVQLARTALTILEKALPADHPGLSLPLSALGAALLASGDAAAAKPPLERALALRAEHPGEPARLAALRWTLARALAPDDPGRARALAAQARAFFQERGERDRLAALDAWTASLGP